MSNNVTAAKPKVAGSIWRAPIGTTLPTNATDNLDPAFVSMGLLSEDGYKNENSSTTEVIKAWGGQVVYTTQTDKEDKFSFKLISALDVNVLKAVYGDSNVEGDLDAGIVVKVNSAEQEAYIWVIETILNEGVVKRTVIPIAKITEVAEVGYKANDLVGYETTLTATVDEAGNTHYEYIQGK